MTGSPTFVVVVSLAILREDRVLIMKRAATKDHAPGEWELPSGRIERGESPNQAALREAKDETGFNVEVVTPVDTYNFLRGAERTESVGITFLCNWLEGELVLSDEHDDARWVSIEDAEEYGLPGEISIAVRGHDLSR